MRKLFVLFSCMAVLILFRTNDAFAASGKCTVTDVTGKKMVIECTEETKGFDKGSKIKIKSERKKAEEGK